MGFWFSDASAAGQRGFRDLRAGWRLAAFLIVLLGPLGLIELLRVLEPSRARSMPGAAAAALHPITLLVGEGLELAWVAFVTWIFARLERRPVGDFGLPGAGAFGRRFWLGAAWGAAAITLLLGWIAASGAYSFGHVATHGGQLARYGFEWTWAFLAVAFFEEYAFRGYPLVTLDHGLGFWPAAVILSAAFGAVHLGNSGESAVGALAAGLIGLFFCFTWRRTGSLWFAVGLHFAWDFCESFVYGVPDSGLISPGRWLEPRFHGSRWLTGGTVGPEGSVWVFVVIALLFFAFDRAYPAGTEAPSRLGTPSSTA